MIKKIGGNQRNAPNQRKDINDITLRIFYLIVFKQTKPVNVKKV